MLQPIKIGRKPPKKRKNRALSLGSSMLSKMTKPNHTTEMQAPIRAFLLREFILDSYIKESIDNGEACQGRNLRAPNAKLSGAH